MIRLILILLTFINIISQRNANMKYDTFILYFKINTLKAMRMLAVLFDKI